MLWLIPANPNIYDIESAFNDLESLIDKSVFPTAVGPVSIISGIFFIIYLPQF